MKVDAESPSADRRNRGEFRARSPPYLPTGPRPHCDTDVSGVPFSAHYPKAVAEAFSRESQISRVYRSDWSKLTSLAGGTSSASASRQMFRSAMFRRPLSTSLMYR